MEARAPLYTMPVRCYGCGKIIANKWIQYQKDILSLTDGVPVNMANRTIDTQKEKSEKTKEGKLLDKYGLFRYCCRRSILTQPQNKIPIKL